MKRPIKQFFHYYIYDMKLKKKLALSFAILFMLPTLTVTFFLFTRIFRIVLNDTLRSEEVFHSQSALAAENLMIHVAHASDTLTYSLPIQRLFSITKKQAPGAALSRTHLNNLYQLADMAAEPSLIRTIRIYYDDSSYPQLDILNNGRQRLFIPLSAIDSGWLDRFESSPEDRLLCAAPDLSENEKKYCGNLAYLVRLNYLSEDERAEKEAAAYVAVYFSRSSMQQLITHTHLIQGEINFFMNASGEPIDMKDERLSSSIPQIPHSLFEQLKQKEQFIPADLDGSLVYAASFSINGSDWYLMSVIPRQSLKAAGVSMILQFIAFYGVISLLALFLAYRLSKSFADRIIHVALQMETIRSGRPRPLLLKNAGNDEIGILSGAYNFMTAEINELLNQKELAAKELQKAEFRALQAQINPHFLYNTLDMINWLAKSGQISQVSQAVQALTRFYRLTLGQKELFGTIDDEITHVTLYMQLQNMRYNHCADFIADIPPELGSLTIPKLTFQPIVENALLHGILMKEEKKGCILLTGWREGEDAVLVISDDGAGIAPEKLDTLLDSLSADNGLTSLRHIGVSNTNLRLKSLYGDAYGLSFTSTPGQGTEVTVRIPARPVSL